MRLSGAVLALVFALAARPAAAEPPNFVFILADDLGWMDLGVQGSDFYETPRIDRLAAEGVRFTNAYAAANSCSPTRGSILTGRYPAATHLTDWIPGRTPPGAKLAPPRWTNYLRLQETTIAEALAPAGYVSAAIGKWHLGQRGWWPEDQGFAVSFGGSHAGSHGSMFPPYWPLAKIRELGWRPIPDERPGEYLTDRLTREAEDFLDAHRDRPFFLYLSHYAVHTRIQGKPETVAKYRAKSPGRLHRNAEYAAMVEGVDSSVGRIVDKLAALGLAERTLVVFFSDNGGLSKNGEITSNGPLRGEKSSPWEGGVRVPLIARGPDAKPGLVVDEPVISVDFFPTFLELAGLPVPANVDGASLTPALRGEAEFRREPIYWHYPHYNAHTPVVTTTPHGAVRDGRYKLVEFFEDGRTELYDLSEDLGEQRDLAGMLPEVARRLHDDLRAWRARAGAQMPTPNPAADETKYLKYKEEKLWRAIGAYEQQTAFPEP